MALNIDTLKTRSLTAVIFVLVMLAGLLWNRWSFVLLFTLIHMGCWYEFVQLMKKIYGARYMPYCAWGLIYITMPVAMLIDLRFDNIVYKGGTVFFDGGYIEPLIIILSIWVNDTMAYIVGSLIGKTPFNKISPKKTWEGTAGGAVLCVMVVSLVGYFITDKFYNWSVIAVICAIFGTAGDLLESKLKRMAGVKDSGSFMPGHGGFLDRFDSLLVASPFVWLFIKLVG